VRFSFALMQKTLLWLHACKTAADEEGINQGIVNSSHVKNLLLIKKMS
jgi:hypothetical protein